MATKFNQIQKLSGSKCDP